MHPDDEGIVSVNINIHLFKEDDEFFLNGFSSL